MLKVKLILLLCVLSSGKLLACGCSLLDFDEAVKSAAEIFIGKVYDVEYIYYSLNDYDLDSTDNTLKRASGDEYSMRKVTFEVERKWKGSSNKFVSIYDHLNSCSFNFEDFDRYIVFTSSSKLFPIGDDSLFQGFPNTTGYNTHFCSRTLPDPRRYPWTENIITEPFNDIPSLDQRFPHPIMLIDFRILYGSIALIAFAVTIWVIKYKRKVTS
jgi:hypothetical protein